MLFNSLTFVIFFLVFYVIYLSTQRNLRAQNHVILVSSAIFYGCWDWRFLALLAFTIVIDYFVSVNMGKSENDARRKRMLLISLASNLGVLGFFKYFNFFASSVHDLLSMAGLSVSPLTLHVILPVGISFYTFQSLSYTIDVYRRKIAPAPSLTDFATFVCFFPQLIAGPIERASELLPRVLSPRVITVQSVDAGLHLLLWGYFKKLVVADNVAVIANGVFNSYEKFHGFDLWIGVVAFAIQIYCDFSGYSDIARGLAKLLGFDLMVNFKLPYFSLNPQEFWSRWHISLSTWLRDYLYIPLGGNRRGERRTYTNLLITMLLGGLWHGATWNFVIWGGYHGSILAVHRYLNGLPAVKAVSMRQGGTVGRVVRWLAMTTLTLIGWLFFRARSLEQVSGMLLGLFQFQPTVNMSNLMRLVFYATPLVLHDWYQHRTGDLLAVMRWPAWARVLYTVVVVMWIALFGYRLATEFIYFQF